MKEKTLSRTISFWLTIAWMYTFGALIAAIYAWRMSLVTGNQQTKDKLRKDADNEITHFCYFMIITLVIGVGIALMIIHRSPP
ncbi:MAG: hypothetical protein NTX91_04520 [candidate division SR1 bacterium]|nr:hypothetical protein [candidate division SR1 bacterium]